MIEQMCNAYRREDVNEAVSLNLRCELYTHNTGKHKTTLNEDIVILFDLKETDDNDSN